MSQKHANTYVWSCENDVFTDSGTFDLLSEHTKTFYPLLCNFLRLDKAPDVHWHVGHVSTPQAAHIRLREIERAGRRLWPGIAPTLADNTISFHDPEPGPD